MVRAATLAATLLLAGCKEDEFQRHHEHYKLMVSAKADERLLCEEAKTLAHLAAERRKSGELNIWSVMTNLHCNAAEREK